MHVIKYQLADQLALELSQIFHQVMYSRWAWTVYTDWMIVNVLLLEYTMKTKSVDDRDCIVQETVLWQ